MDNFVVNCRERVYAKTEKALSPHVGVPWHTQHEAPKGDYKEITLEEAVKMGFKTSQKDQK